LQRRSQRGPQPREPFVTKAFLQLVLALEADYHLDLVASLSECGLKLRKLLKARVERPPLYPAFEPSQFRRRAG